jgi:hypothetical protein
VTVATMYDRIDQLSDDQVLEAVNLVAGDIFGAKSDQEVLSEISDLAGMDPGDLTMSVGAATPNEVAALGRAALVAAVGSGHEAAVEQAVDELGQKALLLEIFVIGVLALGALHALQTKGRKEVVREEEITVAPDGSVTVKTTETERNYSVGESLAPLATAVLKSGLPG